MDIAGVFGQLLSMLFGFGFLVLLFGIGFTLGLAALITWVVKKVWYSGEKAPKRKNIKKPKLEVYQPTESNDRKWYPTGWTFNERTQLWEPPDYLNKESKEKWEWDPDKQIWVDRNKENRMDRYRKYHEGKPLTFEEWKAQREKEQQEQQK